jgi:acyl-[acyl-carrier-protein]-phospholipid O-acyltransferase/long-chain-fatty-acid--[acyl-carrier-protein] ligase
VKTIIARCFSFLWLDTDSWWIGALILLGALAFAVIFRYQLLVRLPLWLITHTIYRVRVHGAENVPATGPALLVSNHVSHLDALLVLASQKRRVRFMMWAPYSRMPVLRWIFRLLNVSPIDGSAGPRAIISALRAASDALANGEVVCIFAEGGITRTGFLLPFQRGFEQIVKRSPAPIIPVYLDQLWGSIFSFQKQRFFWKWPKQVPIPSTPRSVRHCRRRRRRSRCGRRCRRCRPSRRFAAPANAGPCIASSCAWPAVIRCGHA